MAPEVEQPENGGTHRPHEPSEPWGWGCRPRTVPTRRPAPASRAIARSRSLRAPFVLKCRKMNWTRGLLRAWVVLSAVWVVCATPAAWTVWRKSASPAAASRPATQSLEPGTQPPRGNNHDPFAAVGAIPVPAPAPSAPIQFQTPGLTEKIAAANAAAADPNWKPPAAPHPLTGLDPAAFGLGDPVGPAAETVPARAGGWSNWTMAWSKAAGLVFVPPLALLLAGVAIGWVCRGFRQRPS